MSDVDSFIARWKASGASERANYVLFLTELCDLLEVGHPDPASAQTAQNAYTFERNVRFDDGEGSPGAEAGLLKLSQALLRLSLDRRP